MLYIRLSSKRYFFVNEYYFLIPLMLAVDIAIIIRVKKKRAKNKVQSEELKRTDKQYKIFHIAMENPIEALQIGCGENILVELVEDYIQVVHTKCVIGKGFRYVNNEKLRKLCHYLFKKKEKTGVIFITKTALCHLVQIYSLDLPAVPIPVPDFIGISDWYQLVKKVISVGFIGIAVPMVSLAQGPLSFVFGLGTGPVELLE